MRYDALMEEAGELTEAQLAEVLDFVRFLKYKAGGPIAPLSSASAGRQDSGTAEEQNSEALYVSGDFYETPSAFRRH